MPVKLSWIFVCACAHAHAYILIHRSMYAYLTLDLQLCMKSWAPLNSKGVLPVTSMRPGIYLEILNSATQENIKTFQAKKPWTISVSWASHALSSLVHLVAEFNIKFRGMNPDKSQRKGRFAWATENGEWYICHSSSWTHKTWGQKPEKCLGFFSLKYRDLVTGWSLGSGTFLPCSPTAWTPWTWVSWPRLTMDVYLECRHTLNDSPDRISIQVTQVRNYEPDPQLE